MLKIVEYIKKNGLDKTISDFKLKARIYGDYKVHLKYNQIESDMSLPEVQECRGLILEMGTWDVMSCPLYKFFNYGEGNAVNINLATAICLLKLDGTFIHVYFDWNKDEWIAATTGMSEAEGEVNNITNTTFSTLFWGTAKIEKSKLIKGLTYMFELCTPENIVVTPHKEYKVILLAIRDLKSLNEFTYQGLFDIAKELGVEVVKSVNMKMSSLDEIKFNFENMPFSEEGYVVVDSNFNRVKIKNPAYVAAHMLKGKSAFHHIMDIIKTNEVDEFIATFPNRNLEILELNKKYHELIAVLNEIWTGLSGCLPNFGCTQKEYAENVFKITNENNLRLFSGLFFSLANNKVTNISEYLKKIDNRKLYELLR